MCPKLDRFWYHEYAKKLMEVKKNQQTIDIFVDERRGKRHFDDPYTKAMNNTKSGQVLPQPNLALPN
jgi:hypothetical protein